MTEETTKKPRTKVELPTSIGNGEGEPIVLADANLGTLEAAQKSRKDWIESFDKNELDTAKLELRAINAEIRKRAK